MRIFFSVFLAILAAALVIWLAAGYLQRHTRLSARMAEIDAKEAEARKARVGLCEMRFDPKFAAEAKSWKSTASRGETSPEAAAIAEMRRQAREGKP